MWKDQVDSSLFQTALYSVICDSLVYPKLITLCQQSILDEAKKKYRQTTKKQTKKQEKRQAKQREQYNLLFEEPVLWLRDDLTMDLGWLPLLVIHPGTPITVPGFSLPY